MKLAAEIKSALALKSKSEFTETVKKIIYMLLYFAAGALSAVINEMGAFSPFGIAFVTAVKNVYLIPCAAGAAAGYILTQDSVTALRYLAAIVSAAVIIKLLSDSEKIKKFRLIPPFVTFLTLFLTSFIMLFSHPSDFRAFLIFFGEAALGFACSYFFSSALGALELFGEQEGFNVKDITFLSLTLFAMLFSLEKITVFGLSVSRVIAAAVILVISYAYKESGGALTGAAAALVFSMSREAGPLALLCCACGLAAGVFSYMGKFAVSAAYFGTYLIMFILNYDSYGQINLLAENFVACLIFILIKTDALKRFSDFLAIRKEPSDSEAQRKLVTDRLNCAAGAVESAANAICAAAGILKYEDGESEVGVYSQIKNSVCEDCRHRERCWDKNFNDSKKAFDDMSEILKNRQTVGRNNLPKYLSGCCVNTDRLIDVFNRVYLNYLCSQLCDKKIEKIRQITAEQFDCVRNVLSEAAQPLKKGVRFDTARADRVAEMLLNRFSLKTKGVLCLVDENGRLRLEISFDEKLSKIRESDLRPALEEACETDFDKPVVNENGKSVTLCICQKTKYRVEIAAARAAADPKKHCGDNFESFYDGKGNYTVILSDGMGTGMRACVDSSLAVCVCGKLLRAGFDYGSVIRLTNCALLLKSAEESLATLDIMQIDLYTGKTSFYKAGAASSFIKKNEIVTEIRQISMPIGILNEVNFSKSDDSMSQGNIAMLASDGAFEYSELAVKNSLAIAVDEKVEEIAERSAARAKKAGKGRRNDDITVIAVRLVKNG